MFKKKNAKIYFHLSSLFSLIRLFKFLEFFIFSGIFQLPK